MADEQLRFHEQLRLRVNEILTVIRCKTGASVDDKTMTARYTNYRVHVISAIQGDDSVLCLVGCFERQVYDENGKITKKEYRSSPVDIGLLGQPMCRETTIMKALQAISADILAAMVGALNPVHALARCANRTREVFPINIYSTPELIEMMGQCDEAARQIADTNTDVEHSIRAAAHDAFATDPRYADWTMAILQGASMTNRLTELVYELSELISIPITRKRRIFVSLGFCYLVYRNIVQSGDWKKFTDIVTRNFAHISEALNAKEA